MPKLMIDGREITVEPGSTILEAGRRLGIEIPTLCHLKGVHEEASCLICVVQEVGSGRLVPACAMRATEGMEILTRTVEVQKARHLALQLLVNDHQGNCLAPCQKACPFQLNIPEMIRLFRQGRSAEVQKLVRDDLIFPGVLGRVCPGYCERSCGSFRPDSSPEPVGVRLIHRYISELMVDQTASVPLERKTGAHFKVAIVGAGVTGLTAAHRLLGAGYVCHLFEAKAEPGGRLREEFPETVLPKEIIDREIQAIFDLGAQFTNNTRVGKEITLEELRSKYAAVVIAWGKTHPGTLNEGGLVFSEKGIQVEAGSYLTNLDGIFAGGTTVHPGQTILRSVADGKGIAASIQQYLKEQPFAPEPRPFISHFKKPARHRVDLKHQKKPPVRDNEFYVQAGVLLEDVPLLEADRCLSCDCSKAETCRLRQYATEYQLIQKPVETEPERERSLASYDALTFDAGKCIQCGICVRLTEKANTRCVFSFKGRGAATILGIPVDEPVEEAFWRIIPELEANCPTGALMSKKCEV